MVKKFSLLGRLRTLVSLKTPGNLWKPHLRGTPMRGLGGRLLSGPSHLLPYYGRPPRPFALPLWQSFFTIGLKLRTMPF